MAKFVSFRYLLAFFLLNLCLKDIHASPNLAFAFENFGEGSNYESRLALSGDAKVAIHNRSVELASWPFTSAGRLICKEPINLVNSTNMVSFSTHFVFSMPGHNGVGLAFFMLPSNFPHNSSDVTSMVMLGAKTPKFIAIGFDTYTDRKHGDANGHHVGMDIGPPFSAKLTNDSSLHIALKSGEKLQAWINYEANSRRRIEVRLTKSGGVKPVEPLLSYPIDLSEMWRGDNVTVGLSSLSTSGDSSPGTIIYSWSFDSRMMPQWIHSEPLDPDDFGNKGERLKISKRRGECGVMRILGALVFVFGCGAMGAFLVLYLWGVFGNRRPVAPEEYDDKFDVSLGHETVEDGKK